MQLKPPAIGLHSDFVVGQTPNALKKTETATRDMPIGWKRAFRGRYGNKLKGARARAQIQPEATSEKEIAVSDLIAGHTQCARSC